MGDWNSCSATAYEQMRSAKRPDLVYLYAFNKPPQEVIKTFTLAALVLGKPLTVGGSAFTLERWLSEEGTKEQYSEVKQHFFSGPLMPPKSFVTAFADFDPDTVDGKTMKALKQYKELVAEALREHKGHGTHLLQAPGVEGVSTWLHAIYDYKSSKGGMVQKLAPIAVAVLAGGVYMLKKFPRK